MSEKSAPPADAQHGNEKREAMSSLRATLTFASFLALPLGLVYMLSHCNHFAPSTTSLTPYPWGYRHPYATTQAKQFLLDNIEKLLAEASASPPNSHIHVRFCAGEGLRECMAYPYDKGCTQIDDMRILSMAEPRMFEGSFGACTVYRRGVKDCVAKKESEEMNVKEFVVNWYMPDEEQEYASDGVVPLVQKEWIADIGSFECRW